MKEVMNGAVEALQIYAADPKTAQVVGEFAKEYFGGVGHNIVGLFGGDWLYYKRLENIARLANGVRKRLAADCVTTPDQVSLALGLPLLKTAADESRDELVELWERLLAAAMNPNKSSLVRRNFIELVGSFDPLDALLFKCIVCENNLSEDARPYFKSKLSVSDDDLELSFNSLVTKNLIRYETNIFDNPKDGSRKIAHVVLLTVLGRALKAALYA